ncbi:MAG: alpha/beta fold hydrolase [Phycisphaerales bacterium]
MIFSLAVWPAAGKFLLSLNSIIDIVHFASIPVFASFLLLFKPKIHKKNLISYCSFFSIIIIVVLFYFVVYSITIPEIRINWLELPLALYFLMSVYLILWLVDKLINIVFSIVFSKIITNKIAVSSARTILRMGVLIFMVTPYLIAIFITHWVKFTDIDKPQGLNQCQYSRVEFSAVDGAKLQGWFITSQNRISDSTVMILSGRSASKNLFIPYARIFTENGYNVLLFDLRGNGSSSGHKYTFAIEEVNDVIAAVDYLRKYKTELSNYIFGYGINEGAAALIGAAAIDERFAAIISDNAGGYEIRIPDWLEKYVPNWLEKSFTETTKMFVRFDIGCPILGQK